MVTFIIGITTSLVELTATVLLFSEDVLTVALLNESMLWVILSYEELEETFTTEEGDVVFTKRSVLFS